MNLHASYPRLTSITLRTCAFLTLTLLVGAGQARAEDITGNLTVSGELDVYGGAFNLGSWSNAASQPGLTTHYAEDGSLAATLTLTGNRPVTHWLWQQMPATGTGFVRQMLLNSNNVLTLYDKATPPNSAIILNPTGTSTFQPNVTFNGSDNQMPNQSASTNASVLTVGLADARYLGPSNVHSILYNASGNLSIGDAASASGTSAMAIGSQANASGAASTVLGIASSATQLGATSIGSYASALAGYATALGYATVANGSGATAVGVGTDATGGNSVALGTFSQASGLNATSLGLYAQASGEGSVALGEEASAAGQYAVVLGQFSVANDYCATAVGHYIRATAYASTATGTAAWAMGNQSTALGFQSAVTGDSATALGMNSAATGNYSVALGGFSKASGSYATALTSSSVASGDYSTAGGNTTASGYYQFAIGKNSVPGGDAHHWVPTDDLFTVGNGASAAAPSNAFSVQKNGDTKVAGNLTVVKALLVQPQGDLSMGEFTAQPSPTP